MSGEHPPVPTMAVIRGGREEEVVWQGFLVLLCLRKGKAEQAAVRRAALSPQLFYRLCKIVK